MPIIDNPQTADQITDQNVYNSDITDGYCYDRISNITITDSPTLEVSSEFKRALNFLNSYGLTMYTNVDAFRPFAVMTRQEAAKMFSNFAVNVLCRTPNNQLVSYTDTENADPTLKPYITLAYQLGLMK